MPIEIIFLVAVSRRGFLHPLFVAPGHSYQPWNSGRRIYHIRKLFIGVGMRLAHEGIAEHADAHLGHFALRSPSFVLRARHRHKSTLVAHCSLPDEWLVISD